jgi:uncharacterized Zn finger protein
MGWGRYSEWRPYVPVDVRRQKAAAKARKKAEAQGRALQPVIASGTKMAKTFWGKAWCDHLHAFRDYANRLPRGATYLRNGSVVDLVIKAGKVEAIVAGSEPYTVSIAIQTLEKKRWKSLRQKCSESIDSLLDLLAGRLSDGIMRELTSTQTGLFPTPREIQMTCSCPDYSSCCKHLAAVMYGVGVRLDTQPELLFLLRGVDHTELVSEAVSAGNLDRELGADGQGGLASADLGELFGIDLAQPVVGTEAAPTAKAAKKPGRGRQATTGVRTTRGKTTAKKSAISKSADAPPARVKAASRKASETRLGWTPRSSVGSAPDTTERSPLSRAKPRGGKRALKTSAVVGSEIQAGAGEARSSSGRSEPAKSRAKRTTQAVLEAETAISAPAARGAAGRKSSKKAGRKAASGKVAPAKARKGRQPLRARGEKPPLPVEHAAHRESPAAPMEESVKVRRPRKLR